MNEVLVLTYLDKIYERKFKIKILVKFKKNYMCSIEMKPLWDATLNGTGFPHNSR